ncbi:G-D-S-L family lipolytic protein [Arenibacter sp. TNZ]|jgi:lysophospholipase L1-like esterase|uniref:GDSL-type esterase/lipase family protein n=1 Tax=Arenibacter TaxID=178469 RepID=UPI000CD42970|nr:MULTISPECIES: GDSL-type esterase/lipase family protein [Arenibacter]MCM4170577.1 G-D-S-L family lipolytic protein [Arenibacter sp. TNZ]
MKLKKLIFLILLFTAFAYGQKAPAFQNEVMALQQKYDTLWDSSKQTIVFAGSSTIRMWKNLESMFPEHQIINSGFGGSQSSDLFHYYNELILRYNPKKVFIYEGDNDIASKKKTREIIDNTRKIIDKVRERNSMTQIVIIAAKPSISRWHLKRKYKKLNRHFKKLCKKESTLEYANVWDVMMDDKKVRQDIFLGDGLHMNSKGYDLWFSVIQPFMN